MALLRLLGTAVAAIIAVYIARLIAKGYAIRSRLHKLRGPPHSMLWGHLQAMGEQVAVLPKRLHPHSIPLRIMKKYKLPGCFYLDIWPFGDSMLVVMDPDASQQLSVQHTALKHESLPRFLGKLAGPDDMVSTDGPIWKKWRSIFNPGFAGSHLMSLVPGMVDQGVIYTDVLAEHAATGDVFRLEEATTRLTIDVIGKVALDLDFNMQRGDNACVHALRDQVFWLPNEGPANPLVGWNPYAWYRLWRNDRIMKDYIGKVLDERFATKEANLLPRKDRKRTIMDLALDSYLSGEAEADENGQRPKNAAKPQLDQEFRAGAITQIRIFLFAGHDTTSSTICYALYLLSKHPACLEQIRQEHERILGPVDAAAETIRRDPYILNKLEYTNAVVKETLRLFPAASGPRRGEPGLFVRDPATGESLPTEGLMVWLVHYGTHRNPAVWADPDSFQPARFLVGHPDAARVPEGAWRPFEMGPRNCIGQNLAMLEARIMLALVCRRFDVSTALERLDELKNDGSSWARDASFRGGIQEHDGEELYQVLVGAAKPREGMPARVSLSNWKAE